jgi:cyclin-C
VLHRLILVVVADFLGLDTSKLGECEFFMISELNSQLIVHQPYRTLASVQGDLSLTSEESALAWSVINDSYMTDLPLLYAPHVIAVTAILLALVCKPSTTPSSSGSGNGQGSSANAPVISNSTMKQAANVLAQAQGQGTNGSAAATGGSGRTRNSSSAAAGAGSGQKDRASSKIQRFASWLADSTIDIEAIVDTTQELISFYEFHEQYSDKVAREQINRFVKARGLDK